MNNFLLFVIISSVISIVYGLVVAQRILKKSAGNEKMQGIARAIQEGATAYLNRQYRSIAVIAVILFLLMGFIPALGWTVASGFIFGAILSGLAGYVGMNQCANCGSGQNRPPASFGLGFRRRLGHRTFSGRAFPFRSYFVFYF